jgi:hypothetical protein
MARRDLLQLFNEQRPPLGTRVQTAPAGGWRLRWSAT